MTNSGYDVETRIPANGPLVLALKILSKQITIGIYHAVVSLAVKLYRHAVDTYTEESIGIVFGTKKSSSTF